MSLESTYWELELCSSSLGPDSPSEWSVQDYLSDGSGVASPAAVVPSRADVAQQLLDDLEEYVKKEESFSDWFEEEKTILQPLQIFDELQAISTTTSLPASIELTSLTTVVSQAPSVKDEVSCVLGHGHLTPPQSPSHDSLLPLQPASSSSSSSVSYATLEPCGSEYAYLPDMAREMAVVDEVVRGVAQEWEHLEYTDSNSASSDSMSVDESDDPEWKPLVAAAARAPRRSRPYNPQDRRQRKKEQNKNAATRYRMKKKAQVNTIVDEERALVDKNTSLHDKVADVEKEISYLKNLMREMFRAKGLVK